MPDFTQEELSALRDAGLDSARNPAVPIEIAVVLLTAVRKIQAEEARPAASIKVECKRRPNGSAWISVGDPMTGPHFQCDFLGDVDAGPRSVEDFEERPPKWVITTLNLAH